MPTMPFMVVPLPLGTMTANIAAAATNPLTHLNELDTIGMTWKTAAAVSTIGGVVGISGDFGSAQTLDYVSLIGATVASGALFRFILSNVADNSTVVYDSGNVAFTNPTITRADGLYNSHLELPSPMSGRYWTAVVTQAPVLEAAALVLGKKITPSNWYAPGFQYGVEDLGKVEVGPYGVADLTPGRIFRTLAFSLGWSSEVEFETKIRPLAELIGTQKVVFICFDPTANAYRQARSYMGWLRKPLVAQHQATTPDGPRFKMDFELLSLI